MIEIKRQGEIHISTREERIEFFEGIRELCLSNKELIKAIEKSKREQTKLF